MSPTRTGNLREPAMTTRLALIVATLMVLLAPVARAADPTASTKKLIAVLQSDAPLFEKARACQQLGEIGTPEAVPVLAGLLTDPKLSAYARSGLEGIPDPSAAAALRDAMQKMKGPLLAGVVNSLGVLRDPQAVDGCWPRLRRTRPRASSKRRCWRWGTFPHRHRPSLEEALANGTDASRGEAAAACLLAADRQRTSGDLNRAAGAL